MLACGRRAVVRSWCASATRRFGIAKSFALTRCVLPGAKPKMICGCEDRDTMSAWVDAFKTVESGQAVHYSVDAPMDGGHVRY